MNISTFQSNLDFIKSLYSNKEWKDEDCKSEILEALEEANERIEQAFGFSMYKLWNHKPSIAAVEKVVKKFPSTLSYDEDDEDRQIPIQYAATGDGGLEYVTILAKEGVKNKVGGDDARGGLLKIDPTDEDEWNTLQCLSNDYTRDDGEDEKRLDVLKELRKMGLLVKRDIKEQKLLLTSCG